MFKNTKIPKEVYQYLERKGYSNFHEKNNIITAENPDNGYIAIMKYVPKSQSIYEVSHFLLKLKKDCKATIYYSAYRNHINNRIEYLLLKG